MKPFLLTGATEVATKRPTRLRIVAYSGSLMTVEGYGPVLIDLAGLDRPETVPILTGHENTLGAIVGSGRPVIHGGELVIAGALSPTPAAEHVAELLRAGVPLQASVGIHPAETQPLRGGDTITVNGREHQIPRGGATLVVRGGLREVSIVAVGADPNTQVSIAARRAAQKGVSEMTEEHATTTQHTESGPVAAERQRVKEIDTICGAEYPNIRARAIDEGWTPDECRRSVLAELRASRPRAPLPRGSAPDVPARDVLAAAALLAAGAPRVDTMYGERVAQAAADLGVHGWRDLAAACCRARGIEPPRGETELIRAASGGQSTYDLGAVVADAINKQVMDAWQATPGTWGEIAKVVPASNFHPVKLLRLGASGHYERVAPGGELKHGTLAAQKLEVTPDTYGRLIGIDRRDIINDDLGLLSGGLADELARTGVNAVNDLVWNEFVDNAAFFTEEKGNRRTGVTSALSIDAVGAAVMVLRQAKDIHGSLVGAVPYALVVPAALEFAARALLTSVTLARNTTTADGLPEGNPIPRDLRLVVEPRLDADSDKRWYLTGAPRLGLLLVAFLNGRQTPIIEVENSFETLGLRLRAYHDFGAALGDSAAGVCADGQ